MKHLSFTTAFDRLRSPRAFVSLFVLLFPAAGCLRRVSYFSPDGRRVEVLNVGFDTAIGSLEAESEQGRIRIEGVASEATVAKDLARLAADLAATARATAEASRP